MGIRVLGEIRPLAPAERHQRANRPLGRPDRFDGRAVVGRPNRDLLPISERRPLGVDQRDQQPDLVGVVDGDCWPTGR